MARLCSLFLRCSCSLLAGVSRMRLGLVAIHVHERFFDFTLRDQLVLLQYKKHEPRDADHDDVAPDGSLKLNRASVNLNEPQPLPISALHLHHHTIHTSKTVRSVISFNKYEYKKRISTHALRRGARGTVAEKINSTHDPEHGAPRTHTDGTHNRQNALK
jgi:hypothetical protein